MLDQVVFYYKIFIILLLNNDSGSHFVQLTHFFVGFLNLLIGISSHSLLHGHYKAVQMFTDAQEPNTIHYIIHLSFSPTLQKLREIFTCFPDDKKITIYT